MRKLLSLSLIPIILLTILAAFPAQVFALNATTPTAASVTNAWAFRHVLEDDDQLYIGQFNIQYALAADTPNWVGEVYLGSVGNGALTYSSVQPWGYFGATATEINWWFAVYFTASEVSALGMTWADANAEVVLSGNPAATWSGAVPYSALNAVVWDTSTTQEGSQDNLETRLRLMGTYYDNVSGGSIDLIENVLGVLRLTEDGEYYYTYTMEIVRLAAPNLFANSITAQTFIHTNLLDDYYVSAADGSATIYGANWISQSFTPNVSYGVSGVQIKALRVGNPGVLAASLRETNVVGEPVGADLTSGTIDGDDLSTFSTGEWYIIPFDADYTVTRAKQYAFIIRATGGDVNNYVNWRGNSASTFNDGRRADSLDSGVTWGNVPLWDMQFSTVSKEGNTLAYPERNAARLKGSAFDLTDLAEEMGLSTMWMSTLFWIGASFCMMLAAMKVNGGNSKIMTPIFIIMTPVGYLTGFLDWVIAAFVLTLCAIAFVYHIFFKPAGV